MLLVKRQCWIPKPIKPFDQETARYFPHHALGVQEAGSRKNYLCIRGSDIKGSRAEPRLSNQPKTSSLVPGFFLLFFCVFACVLLSAATNHGFPWWRATGRPSLTCTRNFIQSSITPNEAAAPCLRCTLLLFSGGKTGRGVASQSHTGIWLEEKGKFEIWKVKISGVLLLNVRNVQECTWHTRIRERWGVGGYLYAENRQWHSARGHWYPESRWEGEPMQISESKGKWHFAVGCC